MNDFDTYEYVPVDENPEGPHTVTFTVTIKADGATQVEVRERGRAPRRVQPRGR